MTRHAPEPNPSPLPRQLIDLPQLPLGFNDIEFDIQLPPRLIPPHMREEYMRVGYTKHFFPEQEIATLVDGTDVNLVGLIYLWPDANTRSERFAVERRSDKAVFLATREQLSALIDPASPPVRMSDLISAASREGLRHAFGDNTLP